MIAGRYEILAWIGAGGMATVWKARDTVLDRQVALKAVRLPAELPDAAREDSFTRLRREARLAAKLHHPSIVQVYDVLTVDEQPWIVMELLAGRSLDDIIQEDGPLSVDEAAAIAITLLDALGAAHEAGVLHRDVKPANVMIDGEGRATLTDFGIAFQLGDVSTTETSYVLGSPAYLAPERLHGDEVGPSSDLYSLGATIYTAVEGRLPYARIDQLVTLAAVVTDPPDPMRRAGWLEPVLLGMLEKDPHRRWSPERTRRVLTAGQRSAPRTASRRPVDARTSTPKPVKTDARVLPPTDFPAGQPGSGIRPSMMVTILALVLGLGIPIFGSTALYLHDTWLKSSASRTDPPSWVDIPSPSTRPTPNALSIPSYAIEGAPVPVPDPASKDVLLLGYDVRLHGGNVFVRRMTPRNGNTVWTGPDFGTTGAGLVLAVAGTSVAINRNTVVGFDPATGAERWRKTLADDLKPSCDGLCAAVVGDHVVVLSLDGTLQSFALSNGAPAWKARVSSSTQYLHAGGGMIAVDDPTDGTPEVRGLRFFNAANGSARTLAPSCGVFGGTAHPKHLEDWRFSTDNLSLMVVFTGAFTCLQGYDVASGAKRWEHTYQGGGPVPVAWGSTQSSQVGGTEWTDSPNPDARLWLADPSTGEVRELIGNTGYVLHPHGIVNGVAIVEATKPAEAGYLWGIDVSSGRRLWQQPSRVLPTPASQLVSVGTTTVSVISCAGFPVDGDTGGCHYDSLNLKSGAALCAAPFPYGGPIANVVGVIGSSGYDLVQLPNDSLVVVDTATGVVTHLFNGP
ncbi:hypothetical protein GCM10009765_25310 [Fodinicola feengrottensis]|uniref:non-specific serine/threonine protein kinase n=1 Tax=Fodinicola feengrottensis TaxID=435914 RepID=A0ABN2GQ44_9ACTN